MDENKIIEETEVMETETETKKENKIMSGIKNGFSKVKGSKTTKVVLGVLAGAAAIGGVAYLAFKNHGDCYDEFENDDEDFDYEVVDDTSSEN